MTLFRPSKNVFFSSISFVLRRNLWPSCCDMYAYRSSYIAYSYRSGIKISTKQPNSIGGRPPHSAGTNPSLVLCRVVCPSLCLFTAPFRHWNATKHPLRIGCLSCHLSTVMPISDVGYSGLLGQSNYNTLLGLVTSVLVNLLNGTVNFLMLPTAL